MCTLASLPLRSSTMGTYSTWRVCVWWFGDSGFFLFFLVLSTHIFHVWVCTYLYVLHSDGSVKGIATVDQGIAKDGSPKVSNYYHLLQETGVCVCVCAGWVCPWDGATCQTYSLWRGLPWLSHKDTLPAVQSPTQLPTPDLWLGSQGGE